MSWFKRNTSTPDSAFAAAPVEELRSVVVGKGPFTQDNPAALAVLGFGTHNFTGEAVNENSALTLSALWRAVNVIAGTLAGLPLKTYRELETGERERTKSFLDNPAGPDSVTKFEWTETVVAHLVLYSEAFLYHRYNEGGALVGLQIIHPHCISVERMADHTQWPEGKRFTITLQNGTQKYLSARVLTHVVGLSTDGLRGISLLDMAANSVGISLAGERSAARVFSNGALISGVLVPDEEEDLDQDDIDGLRSLIDTKLIGTQNAGSVPILNRVLKFVPWAMTAEQAQFLETRAFQVEEISRWTGVPPHLLMQTEKQTSWGTGVAEQNKGLATYTLMPYAKRLTERLSRLLPQPRWVEFDFAGLEAGSAQEEITLLMAQVNGGYLTLNEARKVRNLPPLPDGDEVRVPSGVMLMTQLLAQAETAANPPEPEPEPDAPDDVDSEENPDSIQE